MKGVMAFGLVDLSWFRKGAKRDSSVVSDRQDARPTNKTSSLEVTAGDGRPGTDVGVGVGEGEGQEAGVDVDVELAVESNNNSPVGQGMKTPSKTTTNSRDPDKERVTTFLCATPTDTWFDPALPTTFYPTGLVSPHSSPTSRAMPGKTTPTASGTKPASAAKPSRATPKSTETSSNAAVTNANNTTATSTTTAEDNAARKGQKKKTDINISNNLTTPTPTITPIAHSITNPQSYHSTSPLIFHSDANTPNMQRKIWVRRPGASPTRVTVHEDDLVDNVRDVILHKYSNSLGKSIDSPDITLKICSREQTTKGGSAERVLGPEESIGRTLDSYYPGGQTIEEALIIEVPARRTPRPSPRVGEHQYSYYTVDELRPSDSAREYFPPMGALHSPHLTGHAPSNPQHHPSMHSMAVLTTGQLPPLASPGTHTSRRHGRPKYGRQPTSSPTILHTQQPNGNITEPKAQLNGITTSSIAPPPTPPVSNPTDQHKPSITPPNRNSSPRPGQRSRRTKKSQSGIPNATTQPAAGPRSMNGDPPPPPKPASAGLLDGSVPPINVLIVEDNVINLKLLEAFMKRLKVRWKSAMNGKEAVAVWRTGGFHLVLMDIQLPVMNGLDATKEIRRLEGVNGIGVFSGTTLEGVQQSPKGDTKCEGDAMVESSEDKLGDRSLFKSPVIIVALTASSLQSDRHEALAAGCNDFLTKPVNFVWMERKVTEWGCMQALIDYDGWRKWKAYASERAKQDPALREKEEKEEKAKNKAQLRAMFTRPPPSTRDGGIASTTAASPTSAPREKESTPTSTTAGTVDGKLTGKDAAGSTSTTASGSLSSASTLTTSNSPDTTANGTPVSGGATTVPTVPSVTTPSMKKPPGKSHKARIVSSLGITPEADETAV